MTITDLDAAVGKAVVGRVRTILAKLGERSEPVVIGIETPGPPQWAESGRLALAGRQVRFVACPSVLAVLDALVEKQDSDEDLVLLTNQSEDELGDAIKSRLHENRLFDVSRHRLLNDVLQPKWVDVQIRDQRWEWLADALIELAQVGETSSLHGTRLTLELAVGHVLRERLKPLDPDDLDLVRVVEVADDSEWRSRWRALPATHRDGLINWFGDRLGEPAGLVLRLATDRDDVLADLLVADVLTTSPGSDAELATLFGGFASSRWGAPWPAADRIRPAADAAVDIVRSTRNERVSQQLRRADTMLADLGAVRYARRSDVLHEGFEQRLLGAARSLSESTVDELRAHRDCVERAALVRRVEAALRVQRWLDSSPVQPDSVRGWLTAYARDLSWVDRELTQLCQGGPEKVASTFERLTRAATDRRRQLDLSFAKILPTAASARPDDLLAVETVLPKVVGPLAETHKVLLVVVDGMAMPVAIELAESIVDGGRGGWTEVVRVADGGREPVLAAFPTVTEFSRTSLFTATLRAGDAAAERVAFAAHKFWPPQTKASLTHKDRLAGRDGADLGAELAATLGSVASKRVVAGVVLNAVDESLPASRQADDPTWHHRHVPGLPELLERAALSGWVVVLTSDHGHILDHGATTQRADSTGGARWRRPDPRAPNPDEILLRGRRVLTPDNEAVLAVTEDLRYRRKAHGYHGGASLAEVTIPLIVLLPPGVIGLDGWSFHSLGAPDWWTGRAAAPAPVSPPKPKPRKRTEPAAPQTTLFAEEPAAGRGRRLVASPTFTALHQGFPRNRVLDADVVARIVDLLAEAGGRAPVGDVLRAAGSAGRNPRGLVTALQRLLNVDQFAVVELADQDRTVVLNQKLLDVQFPDEDAR